MFNWILSLPLIGPILSIINTHAGEGAVDGHKRWSGLRGWLRNVFLAVFFSIGITAALFSNEIKVFIESGLFVIAFDSFRAKPGALVVSVFPNVLGFGIGVYALIFALSKKFVREVQEVAEKYNEIKNGRRSVLALNSDLSYPLVIIFIALIVSVWQQAFPEVVSLVIVCWVLFWHGIIATLDVVATLFGLGEQSILEKLEAASEDELK